MVLTSMNRLQVVLNVYLAPEWRIKGRRSQNGPRRLVGFNRPSERYPPWQICLLPEVSWREHKLAASFVSPFGGSTLQFCC